MQKNILWHVLENSQIATAVSQHILEAAAKAIADHGNFKLVLAGGSTPEKVYRLLGDAKTDWSLWTIYFGDERCLPKEHADRNSLMAQTSFLDKVAIPKEQIFVIPAELGPETAAKLYQQVVAKALPFDMVLLGMGEDGHTASLFPGQTHPENELAHAVYDSPKPPLERVSMSATALSNTTELIFIITGAGKKDAVKLWRLGQDLPIARIVPNNAVDVYIDTEAYA